MRYTENNLKDFERHQSEKKMFSVDDRETAEGGKSLSSYQPPSRVSSLPSTVRNAMLSAYQVEATRCNSNIFR